MALLTLISFASFAQTREVIEVRDGLIVDVNGNAQEVKGGGYFPEKSLISIAQEVASLRAENQALKSSPVATPTILAGTALVAVILGIVSGALLAAQVRR